MKRTLTILCALALTLSLLSGCGGAQEASNESDDELLPPQGDGENRDIEEADEDWETDLLLGQYDPTVDSAGDDPFLAWDHVEYWEFGSPDEYRDWELRLNEMDGDGFTTGEQLAFTIRFPRICDIEFSIINMDVGFANGPVKMGGYGPMYYTIHSDEELYDNVLIVPERFEYDAMTGTQYELTQTQSNTLGGVWDGDGWRRFVSAGLNDNAVLTYAIDLGEGRVTTMYFYVSYTAMEDDLALYDAIADSVQVIG